MRKLVASFALQRGGGEEGAMERGKGDCKRIAERNDRSAPRNHRPSILAAVDTPSVSDGSLVFPSMKVAENLKRAITPNDYSFRLESPAFRARD